MEAKPEAKFYCRLASEDGSAMACGDQCAACLRESMPPQEVSLAAASIEKLEAEVAQLPQGPQVKEQIIITLWDDGNFQVTGPFDNRIAFRGLLDLARDAEFEEAAKRRAEQQRIALQRSRETRLQRWQRERRERRDAAALKAAQDRAASKT